MQVANLPLEATVTMRCEASNIIADAMATLNSFHSPMITPHKRKDTSIKVSGTVQPWSQEQAREQYERGIALHAYGVKLSKRYNHLR